MTCETCKYWTTPDPYANGCGKCQKITTEDRDVMAFATPGYDEGGELYTKPTFGCVLHALTTPRETLMNHPLIDNTIACLRLLKRRMDETLDCTFIILQDGHVTPTRVMLDWLEDEWKKEKEKDPDDDSRIVAPPLAQPVAPSQKTPFECSF